jgi:hypothetical protein
MEIGAKNAEDAENKKRENSLNLQNQLFITSIHLLQINGKNILKQESTIGKLLLKQLVGKMLFEENTGQKMIQ